MQSTKPYLSFQVSCTSQVTSLARADPTKKSEGGFFCGVPTDNRKTGYYGGVAHAPQNLSNNFFSC